MPRHAFVCQQCAYRHAKWLGRCPACGAWAAMVEEADAAPGTPPGSADRAELLPYAEIAVGDEARRSSGIEEFDRVLGGGLVAGMVALLGGEPGVGKSTLALQCAAALSARGDTVVYATGEESAAQLKLRGQRLAVEAEGLLVVAETDVDALVHAARRAKPRLLVVDSIQAVRCAELSSVPGSVGQVRECAARLVAFAKASAVPVLLVGHVTKDGAIAGPRVLEHVVDTVVQFEGDRHHAHRLLRSRKNRFGASGEVGVFSMEESGLRGVGNPSELFLSERAQGAPGSCVLAAVEASRPLLVEVQALVGPASGGSPRRATVGIDGHRAALILAVLQRRAGLDLAGRDLFVNVPGGIQISEPAADLAVAMAIASSLAGVPAPPEWIVAGEIGLTGEVRAVGRMAARLREARRMGFTRALVPRGGKLVNDDIEATTVGDVRAAIARLFGQTPEAGQIG